MPYVIFHAGSHGLYTSLGLPVDPLLGTANNLSLQLPVPLGTYPEVMAKTVAPSVVIFEGIPPISVKIVEKICHWEFIDLSKLLVNQDNQPEESTAVVGGQSMVLESQSRSQRKTTAINDILAWC